MTISMAALPAPVTPLTSLRHPRSRDTGRLVSGRGYAAEVVAMLDHEVRTPLASIVGWTELLADGMIGDLSDDQQDVVERIERSVTQLSDLVGTLLSVSTASLAQPSGALALGRLELALANVAAHPA